MSTTDHPDDRRPYVGDGVDGCLRSAAIDRDESLGLPLPGQPGWSLATEDRRDALADSAGRWVAQAERLAGARPVRVVEYDPFVEYGVMVVGRGYGPTIGDTVGCGPFDRLDAAQETALAWLADGVPVRVVQRPVAPWTPTVAD